MIALIMEWNPEETEKIYWNRLYHNILWASEVLLSYIIILLFMLTHSDLSMLSLLQHIQDIQDTGSTSL